MKPGDTVYMKAGRGYLRVTVTSVATIQDYVAVRVSNGWIRKSTDFVTESDYRKIQDERHARRNEMARARRTRKAAEKFAPVILAYQQGARTYPEFAAALHTIVCKIVSKVWQAHRRGLIAIDLEAGKVKKTKPSKTHEQPA